MSLGSWMKVNLTGKMKTIYSYRSFPLFHPGLSSRPIWLRWKCNHIIIIVLYYSVYCHKRDRLLQLWYTFHVKIWERCTLLVFSEGECLLSVYTNAKNLTRVKMELLREKDYRQLYLVISLLFSPCLSLRPPDLTKLMWCSCLFPAKCIDDDDDE